MSKKKHIIFLDKMHGLSFSLKSSLNNLDSHFWTWIPLQPSPQARSA